MIIYLQKMRNSQNMKSMINFAGNLNEKDAKCLKINQIYEKCLNLKDFNFAESFQV